MVKVSSIATFCWQEDGFVVKGDHIDATSSSPKDEVRADDYDDYDDYDDVDEPSVTAAAVQKLQERSSAIHTSSLPNRFASSGSIEYDRSIPDLTVEEELISISAKSPIVFISAKSPIVLVSSETTIKDSQHVATLRNLEERITGNQVKCISKNSYLIYQQLEVDRNPQIGICLALETRDLLENIKIKRHEAVTTTKKSHPAPYFKNPLMLMYRAGREKLERFMSEVVSTMKINVSLKVDDGGLHNVWIIDKSEFDFESCFDEIESLYIADGHHRTEAACAEYRNYMKAHESSTKSKSAVYDEMPAHIKYTMAYVYADTDLTVLPFHRCVKPIPNFSNYDFLAKFRANLSKYFDVYHVPVEALDSNSPINDTALGGGLIKAYFQSNCYFLQNKEFKKFMHPSVSDVMNSLDVLMNLVIAPLLNNEPISNYMKYVPGSSDEIELSYLVDDGQFSILFTMVEVTSTRDIMHTADAGFIWPPKVTCFFPKPHQGLVNRII